MSAEPRRTTRFGYALAFACSLALSTLGLGTSSTLAQSVFSVEPAADSYVIASDPNENRGARRALRVGGAAEASAYLRFDLTGIPWHIERATLRLFGRSRAGRISLHRTRNRGWMENAITAANAPRPRARAGHSTGFRRSRWTRANATRVARAGRTVTIAMTTHGRKARAFASREAARPPRLVIEADPLARPPGASALIAAAGDIACDPESSAYNESAGTANQCRQRYTSDLLVAGELDAVLTLGDNQYESGTLSQFFASYEPTWGRLKAITRPAPGNHEYGDPGATGYFDYFNGAGNATGPAGARGQGWYSYDLGGWHLIALNSNCSAVGGCGEGSAQEQWLKADLASHPSACTLAYWHSPRFSSGDHGDDPDVGAFWEDLHAAGADVVLNGHEHLYERFAPQDPAGSADPSKGIRQFIVGTGGKSLRPLKTVMPNSAVRSSDSFGVLALALYPDRYAWSFVPETRSPFTDSGGGRCV